jgi:hypothetical protein
MQEALADHYRELDDDALLRLLLDRNQLTPEASQALDAEISVRRLSRSDAQKVARADRLFDKRAALEQAKKTSGGLTGRNTALYGSSNIEKKLGGEFYTATKFFILGPFPFIPLGTYRLLRLSRRRWWQWIFGRDYRVIEKLPLDWNQILRIWCKYGLILLILLMALRIFLATHVGR